MQELENIALFDMDGSLANYEQALADDLNAIRCPNEPAITTDNLWELEKSNFMRNRMRLIKSQTGWWLNLKPIRPGMTILDNLMKRGWNCQILTKGPASHSLAWSEKVQWCHKHIAGDVDVHVVSDNKKDAHTGGKGLVYGKILYDDYPDYMLRWLKFRPRGLGIMPVTAHNKDFRNPQVVMFDGTNFDTVYRAVDIARQRKPGEPLILS